MSPPHDGSSKHGSWACGLSLQGALHSSRSGSAVGAGVGTGAGVGSSGSRHAAYTLPASSSPVLQKRHSRSPCALQPMPPFTHSGSLTHGSISENLQDELQSVCSRLLLPSPAAAAAVRPWMSTVPMVSSIADAVAVVRLSPTSRPPGQRAVAAVFLSLRGAGSFSSSPPRPVPNVGKTPNRR